MKRTDIRAGVVYAVKSGYGPPSPIVFLEDGAAGLYSRGDYGRGAPAERDPRIWKAQRGSGYGTSDCGYAAMIRSGASGLMYEDAAAAMAAADPGAELARFLADERPSGEGLMFSIVTSLGQISGLYDEELAAYNAAKEAERARERRLSEERAAESARRLGLVEALSAYGIRARDNSAGKIELSPDEADKLIALLGRED